MKRRSHSPEFKRQVAEYAARLPADARIKPTARAFQEEGLTPVQVRKWLRASPILPEQIERADRENKKLVRERERVHDAILGLVLLFCDGKEALPWHIPYR